MSKSRLPSILVIDDEVRSQESLRCTLEEDFNVFTASGAEEAQRIMEHEFVQVARCDQRMPDASGVEVLRSSAANGEGMDACYSSLNRRISTANAFRHAL
jgi:DNA-binding NtrC family response regulator